MKSGSAIGAVGSTYPGGKINIAAVAPVLTLSSRGNKGTSASE